MPLTRFRWLGQETLDLERKWLPIARMWADHLDEYIRQHGDLDPYPFAYREEALVSFVAVGVVRASVSNVSMCEFETKEHTNESADAWFSLDGTSFLLEAKRLEVGNQSQADWFEKSSELISDAFTQGAGYEQPSDWLAACLFMIPRLPITDQTSRDEVIAEVLQETPAIGQGRRGFQADYYPTMTKDDPGADALRYPGISWVMVFKRPS